MTSQNTTSPNTTSPNRNVQKIAITIALAGFLAACGGGGSAGEAGDAPPSDPATAIVGTWEAKSEVGTLSYEFTADGRFRWESDNRLQTLDGRGTYVIEGNRAALTFDDDDEGEGTFYVELVGADRLREDEGGVEMIYERR